jgi:ribose transport system substrate-binding protein
MKSAVAILAILSIPALAAPGSATPQAPVVALSNAYYGNTWRHQMVEAFEAAAKQAKADGKIADYIVTNGDGSVAQQNSQIGELILKKVDVLLVDAASETAVNGVIEKACSAGIVVISFDSIANAPCNYQLNFDFKRLQGSASRSRLQHAAWQGQRDPSPGGERIGARQRHVQRPGIRLEEVSRH